MNDGETVLWQRLDTSGHELATITRESDGWRVSGVAVFVDGANPCRVDYEIRCGGNWITRRCVLRGVIGVRPVHLDVERDASGNWSVDGVEIVAVHGCADIDLGFSPVTNLLPIRRLELSIGERASVRAAWVRFPNLTLEVLEQTYGRIARDRYIYESAGGTFRRELTVNDFGCVTEYPGLWHAEATAVSR